MCEAEALLADRKHTGRLGSLQGAGIDPQVAARSDHGRELPIERGGGDDDTGALVGTQRREPRFECLEQGRARHRHPVDRHPPESLVLGQPRRQLAERQRVARSDLEQEVDHARGGPGR